MYLPLRCESYVREFYLMYNLKKNVCYEEELFVARRL